MCLCFHSPIQCCFSWISSSSTTLVSHWLLGKSHEPQTSVANPFSPSGFNGEEGITGGGSQHLGHALMTVSGLNHVSWMRLLGYQLVEPPVDVEFRSVVIVCFMLLKLLYQQTTGHSSKLCLQSSECKGALESSACWSS